MNEFEKPTPAEEEPDNKTEKLSDEEVEEKIQRAKNVSDLIDIVSDYNVAERVGYGGGAKSLDSLISHFEYQVNHEDFQEDYLNPNGDIDEDKLDQELEDNDVPEELGVRDAVRRTIVDDFEERMLKAKMEWGE